MYNIHSPHMKYNQALARGQLWHLNRLFVVLGFFVQIYFFNSQELFPFFLTILIVYNQSTVCTTRVVKLRSYQTIYLVIHKNIPVLHVYLAWKLLFYI